MRERRPVLRSLEEAGTLWRSGGAVLDRAGGAARAWMCPAGRTLAVLPDLRQASELAADSRALFPDRPAMLLSELPLTSESVKSRPLLLERGETIRRWTGEGGVLAATPGALMAPCLLGESELSVRRGEDYARDRLAAWLERNGYQRADLVWSPGQYVLRGFIMDVFDPAHALPLRFEFFDEDLDRITAFHPSTQKSATELDEVSLHGMATATEGVPAEMLPGDVRVLLFDPQRLEAQATSFHWLWQELSAGTEEKAVKDWGEIIKVLARLPHLRITDSTEAADAELDVSPLPPFKGDLNVVLRLCRDLESQGCRVAALTTNPRFLDREKGPFSVLGEGLELREAVLTSGFEDRSSGRAFISDRELSGVSASGSTSEWRAPVEWRDRLSEGQLVVHEDYGVGAFRGIREVVTAGVASDALIVEFADDQRLLVPVLQAHKLTPLAEHENEETQLDSLRGTRWRKSVEKDKERAREEAKALLEIYARRELERREPFAAPEELYNDFVRAFPFNETADQLRATAEIMADLSSRFPMDRLLVGDVGFGKTEVALRAAFRVVASGRQVCVLAPTTILAQQHFATFQSRLAGFPVSVGLLSRFVSRKETAATLARAEEGAVDVVIGTHKLLQKGVRFKDLGLLVIDEEHRFGVMHKEGLKRAYGAVDILSLSATPIPRTLAMALRGLRSISVLSTPPEDRLPVTTFAGPWQAPLVRKAVAYELNRGGQVYFVVNRISRMEEQARTLSAFFPEANVQIAHGQMAGRELERTMMDFYAGKIDVLVATTIIESGLDVGRANTIIVDDSQELGLAQMYQLRGRVGRRGENAFAYFFYPDREVLPRETADRLEAISTMTDLGSGYAIARRDLDIRGGGEIGGTSQHGSARNGSFHVFYRMLEQELRRLRGEETRMTDLSFDHGGSVPTFYIPQEDVRVTIYRRLLQTVGLDELASLIEEVRDRFGTPPKEVRLLAAMTALRNFGGRFGLEKVSVRQDGTTVSGDMGLLAPFLGAERGWTVMRARAAGPGGVAGAEGLVGAMRCAGEGMAGSLAAHGSGESGDSVGVESGAAGRVER